MPLTLQTAEKEVLPESPLGDGAAQLLVCPFIPKVPFFLLVKDVFPASA